MRFGVLRLIVVIGAFASACANSTTPEPVGGETHFLRGCDGEGSCGLGLDCVCGVCTKPCVTDNSCRDQSALATCESAGTPIGACDNPQASPVCDVKCALDADCTTLGATYTCESGSCRKVPAGSCVAGGVVYPECSGSDAMVSGDAGNDAGVVGCEVGFVNVGDTCVDIDECAADNGGCDPLTACVNHPGPVVTCGACPVGFVGNGTTGCTPTLTGLTLSSGTLTPALSGGITMYAANVGLVSQTITLTPTAPTSATITINGQAVLSGAAWTSATLDLGDNAFTIVVAHAGQPSRTYTVTVTRGWNQEAYVKASNPGADDGFGYLGTALSADGGTMAIGAYHERSNAAGINGNQDDNSAIQAGAVYVFTRSGGVWTQQAYIKASNTDAGDLFGVSVALSADGDTLAVGAQYEGSNATGINGNQDDNSALNSGAAYVYTRSGSVWSQQAYIKASNAGDGDIFGLSIALSGDGDTMAVGAVYEDSNATGVNGDQDDNSATDSGAAYVFTRSGSVWSQQAYIKASTAGLDDMFGYRVALSADGGTLAVDAYSEASNATGINGNQADNSATYAGAMYVFTRSGSVWSQQAYIKASNTGTQDFFGLSFALSADGDTLAVGASGEDSNATGVDGNQADNSATDGGATYVFTRSGSVWSQQAYIKASNTDASDSFGGSVALSADGGTLAVGASGEDSNATGVDGNQADNSATDSGAVYVFSRSSSVWIQAAYIKASNTAAGDLFGVSVALSADAGTLAAGAGRESSSATGVNGDQADNSASGSGAVYVFR